MPSNSNNTMTAKLTQRRGIIIVGGIRDPETFPLC
jgi:hypothetical protein